MPRRAPGETIEELAIRTAFECGHFWNPQNPGGWDIRQKDLKNLKATDPVVIQALISLSKMDQIAYTRETLKAHGRLPNFDGELGPAMESFVQIGRCPVPDYAPPLGVSFAFDDPDIQRVVLRMQDNALEAVGGGNWPKCHGVGNFHCSIVRIDPGGLPSFLQPVFADVLKRVQAAYSQVGLLWRFVDQGMKDILSGDSLSGETVNSEMSFVNSSSGWIGLAIVGQNEGCGSTIWCKFLNTYKGGSDTTSITTQWTTLIMHELGHNCGLSHSSGGVMNPSIVNNLPGLWFPNDPSTSSLKSWFGGVQVPIPGGTSPIPPDITQGTLEQRIASLELKGSVRDAAIQWLASEVGKLRTK